ncbi:hypothetical protein KVP10_10930 [Candidimonas humi]|jgi:hypothetical protein|uniref:Lipoprotein n=1 Tax=Candidimonas humi TaxID=683355 RepID=A0ABV8P074_9BURK|nr:hypothetical protein [Candidimonas humi]MBV6305402.1 hypothetical protein [Candidimonas humi]
MIPLYRSRIPALCAGSLLALLAGCAVHKPAPAPAVKHAETVQCRAAPQGDALIGTWLSVGREKGIAGQLRTLFVLHPDGTMAYAEQLVRGKRPPQGLDESGCWHREGQALVLRTTQSNGAAVDLHDPIYVNRYAIVSQAGSALTLRGRDGVLKARRMPQGYRLPY